MSNRTAYTQSGVDVEAGDRAVELMRARLTAGGGDMYTATAEFAAAVPLPENMQQPMMLLASDGVGTKTEIARRLGRVDTIGQDLVAMCADDVLCHGGKATYFLDYIALGHIVPERVAEIVGGIGDACDSIGCALVGGETAEHPGLIGDDEFDLAGFCVGFVERGELVNGRNTQPGDLVIGLASSGLHANGYSLVRKLVDNGSLPLSDTLLTPSRLYTNDVLELTAEVRRRGFRLAGMAHVTGGGLPGNLPRALFIGLGVRVEPDSWPQPAIFDQISRAGGIGGREMRATFNCGIGYAVIVEPAARDVTIGFLGTKGIEAWTIGEVRPLTELGGERYVEA
ncbi:MAG: phosphoribosylformylglycinamidine cyclo-ligase [Chloroflexota bacterium]